MEERSLSNKFYKAGVTLISKPDKNTKSKENYKLISLIYIGSKILRIILSNQIPQHKRKYIMISRIYLWDMSMSQQTQMNKYSALPYQKKR